MVKKRLALCSVKNLIIGKSDGLDWDHTSILIICIEYIISGVSQDIIRRTTKTNFFQYHHANKTTIEDISNIILVYTNRDDIFYHRLRTSEISVLTKITRKCEESKFESKKYFKPTKETKYHLTLCIFICVLWITHWFSTFF